MLSGYLPFRSVWELVSRYRIRAWRWFMHESVQMECFKNHLGNVICFSCYTNPLPALASDIWGLVALFGNLDFGQFRSVLKSTIFTVPKIQQTCFLDASYRKWIYWAITFGGDRSWVLLRWAGIFWFLRLANFIDFSISCDPKLNIDTICIVMNWLCDYLRWLMIFWVLCWV